MMSLDKIHTYFTVYLIEIESVDLAIKMTMFFPEYIFGFLGESLVPLSSFVRPFHLSPFRELTITGVINKHIILS